jgi:hypothetical protein
MNDLEFKKLVNYLVYKGVITEPELLDLFSEFGKINIDKRVNDIDDELKIEALVKYFIRDTKKSFLELMA